MDIEIGLWKRLVRTKPKTLAGLAAFAEHVDSYPDQNDEEWLAIATIAKALRDLAPAAEDRRQPETDRARREARRGGVMRVKT